MATPQYHFGRRETPKPSAPKSRLTHFNLNCGKCGNINIHAQIQETDAGTQIILCCPTCRTAEEIPSK